MPSMGLLKPAKRSWQRPKRNEVAMCRAEICWTRSVWNPVARLAGSSLGGEAAGLDEGRVDLPLRREQPLLFVVKLTPHLYANDVPIDLIGRVFGIMCRAKRHRFEILTKNTNPMISLVGARLAVKHLGGRYRRDGGGRPSDRRSARYASAREIYHCSAARGAIARGRCCGI